MRRTVTSEAARFDVDVHLGEIEGDRSGHFDPVILMDLVIVGNAQSAHTSDR